MFALAHHSNPSADVRAIVGFLEAKIASFLEAKIVELSCKHASQTGYDVEATWRVPIDASVVTLGLLPMVSVGGVALTHDHPVKLDRCRWCRAGSRLVVHWMKEQYDWPHVGGRDVCPMEAQIRAARAAVTVGLEVGGIIACK